MMQIRLNKDVCLNKWKNLLSESDQESPFQTPEYYEVLNSVRKSKAIVLAVEIDNIYNALVVVELFKEKGIIGYFSRRAVIHGGIVLRKKVNNSTIAFLLREIFHQIRGEAIYCEIRNYFDYSKYKDLFLECKWIYQEHLNVLLSVSNRSQDSVLAGMKYNRRRELKLSLQAGATVRQTDTEEEINVLYSILKNIYKERVGLPLPNFLYFKNLSKFPFFKVFIVEHENTIIGGCFALYTINGRIYTYYYAGIRDYHKKIYPTHLAIWGAIEFAFRNNLSGIDFMGAGKPDTKYGVREYKLEFGGELVEYGRFLIIANPLLYEIGKIGVNFFKKK